MMTRIIYIGTFLATLFASLAHAATADSLHLGVEELFDRGITASLRLRADALRERSAEEQGRAARRAALPELNVGIDAGAIGQPVVFQRGLSSPTRPDTPDWSQNYAVNLRQPLYAAGKIRLGMKRADLQRQLATLATTDDAATAKLTLLSGYLELMRLYKQEEVLLRNIEEATRRLEDIRRLFREGVITNNDVLRSELQLREDSLSLTETRNALRLTSQELDVLLGLDEETLIVPDTALLSRVSPATGSMQACIEAAYAANPTLAQLEKQTEISRHDLQLTRANAYPTLDLVAGNTLARPVSRTLADLYNNAWSIGLSLSVPLSALYKNKPAVKQAEHDVALATNAEEQQKQQLRMDVRRAWTRHREAMERAEAMRLSIRQAEENYRIMNNRYLNQLAILTDLLDASALRLNSELQYVTARTQAVYAYYELLKTCGQL